MVSYDMDGSVCCIVLCDDVYRTTRPHLSLPGQKQCTVCSMYMDQVVVTTFELSTSMVLLRSYHCTLILSLATCGKEGRKKRVCF